MILGGNMKISTTSWHYRLIQFAEMRVPHNLCPYCRQVLWAALFLFFVGVIIAFGAFLVVSIPLHWVWRWFQPSAIIGACLLIIILTTLLIETVKERRRTERYERARKIKKGEIPPPKPSLIAEWFRAAHDKVCPWLEFSND